jgi:hypothetical protein
MRTKMVIVKAFIDEIDSYFIDQEKTFKYRTNLMLKEQLKDLEIIL